MLTLTSRCFHSVLEGSPLFPSRTLNVGHGFGHRPTDRERRTGSANRFGGLVKLGSHMGIVNRWLATADGIEADQRVDFEVSKVKIYVDGVKADEEVDHSFAFGLWDMFEEGRGYDRAAGECGMD